jgi:hypothetical protein
MTDEAGAMLEEPRFSIGRVLEDSFETSVRTLPQLLAIVGIVAVPLLVWLVLGGERLLLRFAAPTLIDASRDKFDPVLAALVLLLGVITLAIHGAVSDAAFQDLLGDENHVLEHLGRALVAAPSLIPAGLFVFVLFAVSFFMVSLAAGLLSRLHWILGALVGLPGTAVLIALMLQWSVLIPVIVIEQTGPIACFGRSSRLTEGNRWKILAVILIVYGPQAVAKAVLLLLTPTLGPAFIAVLNIVLSGGFIAFNAVLAVMIYGHLRAVKEGSTAATLAEVFE